MGTDMRRISWPGRLLIGLVSVGFGLFFVVASLDAACHADIETRLPLYPGAEVQQTEFTAFRPRGLGHSELVLWTPDERPAVLDWYGARPGVNRRGMAFIGWRVQQNRDGPGSLIHLYSRCM